MNRDEHASAELVARYAAGDPDIPPDRLWAVESHLEGCEVCRVRLADVAPPPVAALSAAVWAALEPELTAPPARVRHWTRLATWATPSLVPWLIMTLLVLFAVVVLELVLPSDAMPSAVLLLAPIGPVLGVAVAWSRGLDPAHELIACTPRAGLELVLRRTTAVLVVVLPVLLLTGWLTGDSAAWWLLPCLGLTSAALALGGLVGVRRAAVATSVLWALLVVGPAVVRNAVPVVLVPAAGPWWAAVLVAGAVVVLMRSRAYVRVDNW
ncbi:zf-HC2 domain-containing protein [Saccharothrix coeruleofusca]|uniref:Membrane protein n=1 Tax=Saccharothrix coeruleofusca TaxID=33919 RepID=A0A918EF78_9PSEU|nr:zf-HC2 domain-containing protein [Saccharothrix coeruleofusca]MBP2339205.1 hypothetical protein [Saccharothrix coeruleofusca]GGP70675.1 membrane protein [Saccharothrix coeruleofusca]